MSASFGSAVGDFFFGVFVLLVRAMERIPSPVFFKACFESGFCRTLGFFILQPSFFAMSSIEWVDVHCHCDSATLASSWKKAGEAANIEFVVSNGVNLASIEQQLADLKKPFFRVALGVHPLEVPGLDETKMTNTMRQLESRLEAFVAVGEIGLDFFRCTDLAGQSRQERVFWAWLEFAKKHNKPVIVHSRGAEAHCLELLEKSGCTKVLLHWFSGPDELVLRAIKGGFYFSIGPSVLQSKRTQAMARLIPRNLFLLETDAPVPFSGSASDPSWIPRVGEAVANIWNESIENVALQTTQNARRFFSLDAEKGWQ